jgi:hypothetical protein
VRLGPTRPSQRLFAPQGRALLPTQCTACTAPCLPGLAVGESSLACHLLPAWAEGPGRPWEREVVLENSPQMGAQTKVQTKSCLPDAVTSWPVHRMLYDELPRAGGGLFWD